MDIKAIIDEEIKKYENKQNDYNQEVLRNYTMNCVEIEIERFKNENIFYEQIRTIVLFNSYHLDQNKDFEDDIVEKNIKLFSNLEKIVILTEKKGIRMEKIKKIKKIASNKVKIIEIELGDLENTGFQEIYSPLKTFLLEKEFKGKSKEICFDMTLGMKYVSVAFYKLAMEEGIEIINWAELHASNGTRKPWTGKIERFSEPLRENRKIKKIINENLRELDLSTVSNMYGMINNNINKDFFEEIGKILKVEEILFNTGLEVGALKDRIEKSYDNIIRLTKKTTGYYKEFLEGLIQIKKSKNQKILDGIYIWLQIEIGCNYLNERNTIKDFFIDNGSFIKTRDEIDEEYESQEMLEEIKEFLLDEYIENQEINEEEQDEILSIGKKMKISNLYEESEKKIYMQDTKLCIEKYNIILDLGSDGKQDPLGKVAHVLMNKNDEYNIWKNEAIARYVIDSDEKVILESEIKEKIMGKSELTQDDEKQYSVKKSRMKDFIIKFNNLLKEKDSRLEDFFIINEDKKRHNEKKKGKIFQLKINEKFHLL